MATADEMLEFLRKIDTKIDATNQKLDKLEAETKSKLNEMIDTVKGNTEKIEAANENIKQSNEAIKNSERKIKQVELKVVGYEANTEQLKFEIEKIKARELENDITIAGIKKQNDENLDALFKKLCDILKVNMNIKDDTNAIYRTKGNDTNPGLIIVKLRASKKKYEILATKRRHGPVMAEQIFNNENQQNNEGSPQLFINHHITPFFNGIMYKARQAKISGKIKAAWANSAGVYYKVNDDDLPKRFESAAEIENILNGDLEQQMDTDTNNPTSNNTNNITERRTFKKPYRGNERPNIGLTTWTKVDHSNRYTPRSYNNNNDKQYTQNNYNNSERQYTHNNYNNNNDNRNRQNNYGTKKRSATHNLSREEHKYHTGPQISGRGYRY